MEQSFSHDVGFRDISYLGLFTKFVGTSWVLLKSEKVSISYEDLCTFMRYVVIIATFPYEVRA